MSERVVIHSRLGNILVAVIGAVFVLASALLLIDYLVNTWGAASLVDRALQLSLAGCAVVGAELLRGAWPAVRQLTRSRALPAHRAATAG